MTTTLRYLASLAATLLFAAAAHAQTWPGKPIRWIVPYPPGGITDTVTRLVTQRVSEALGQPIVVENRPGANSILGADLAAKAAPDGYTFLTVIAAHAANATLYAGKLPFDPVKSFAPVVLIATSGLALVVHPQLPVKSVKEFIQLAKRRPGQMHYSSPGNGGPQHLAMELLKLETGIDIVHVPYKGLAGAITDVMAGHVQAMISATQTAHSAVQSGRLRVLAVMSPERSAAFPAAPTMKEIGLSRLEVETWYGSFAPAGTPAPVITKINAELNALLQLPDIRELLAKQGMTPRGGSPERFGDMVGKELVRWARVVEKAKIKAD